MDQTVSITQAAVAPVLGFGLFVLAMVIQGAALRWLAPRALVGDEHDYLAMASGQRGSTQWLRVPLGAAPVWLAQRIGPAQNINAARLVMSLFASAGVGIGGWFACDQAGPVAGIMAGVILLASAERAVLALHLWPDILMGLCLLLFSMALCAAESTALWFWIGALAAAGFLIRVDFAVLAVFAVVCAARADTVSAPGLAGAAVPTLLAAGAMTVWNGRRYGIWAPDTTFQFNLKVARTETRFPQAPTQELMRRTSRAPDQRPIGAPGRVSGRAVGSAVLLAFRRLITLLGKETFVAQKLMGAQPALYAADLSTRGARLVRGNARGWFSAVLVGFIAYAPVIPAPVLWLVGCVVGVQAAIQTRSRYRQSVFPVLAVHLSIAAATQPPPLSAAVVALAVALVLLIARPRPELAGIGAASPDQQQDS